MKNTNKLFLSAVCMVSLLTGCNNSDKSSDTNSQTPATSNSSTQENHDPVTISYAAWNLGASDSETPNLDRLMIDEFQKKYPWITVNIVERPKVPGTDDDQNWNEFLTTRAATNRLPDVFLVDTLPSYVTNHWCKDITELVKNDSEYQLLSEDIKNAATYEGMTMALPIAVYYHGYVVNKTLFNLQNGDAPKSSTTWTSFINEIKNCSSHTKNGVAGLSGIEHIIHYYASLINPNFEWFTFDGTKFNLDSQEFTDAMNFYLSIYNDKTYCYDSLTPEQVTEYFGEGNVWDDGNILAKWAGSYELGTYQTNIANGTWNRKLDFIGIPVYEDENGNKVKRTMASMDFNAISASTSHPEEAYLLAKWMGFGTEGYAKRLELSKTVEGLNVISFAPIVPDKDLMDEFFALYPGWTEYRKVVESQSFIIESLKYQVGYNECRYKGVYDSEDTMFTIIEKLLTGKVALADIKTELNRKINEIYQTSYASFEEALNKYYKK